MAKGQALKKPQWLESIAKQMDFISILNLAFDGNCDCEVCRRLRDWALRVPPEEHLPRTPGIKTRERW